ncbi:uncharacterized protein LOC135218659 [Macrobrachium nipponense]|uniref:uncharacterized protein LOC135218659 n=1 Tax=Macrobrachium nipponense TaxID=159736 RepID=UPI0030C8B5DE
MDHLTDLLKDILSDPNTAKELQLKRTKATAIVKNVIGSSFKEELAQKLKDTKFSVLCDESTDVGSIKSSCVVVRFYDKDAGAVKCQFWELYDVYDAKNPENTKEGATGKNLFEGLMKTFNQYDIPAKNIIGFGSDGCNVMMGAHNSVASRFREQCPGIFVMKCVCHSAHLCASEACKALPRRCEDLAREIFNHFKCSSKRQSELVQFQEFLNLKPHKILHPSQTRWLSLVAVVVRLLEQWEALKMYFTDIWFSEKVVSAELIFHDLHNPFIKSYYLFLEWILPKFTNFNTYFQSDKTVITVLHEKLCILYRELLLSFMEREYIMKTALESVDPFRQDRYLSDSEMYLGLGVQKELDKLNPNEHKSHLKEFYKRCRDFLVIACAEINKRYDFKDTVISKLCCLTPENAISNSFRKSTPSLYSLIVELPLIVSPHDCSVIQKIDDQWRILPAFKDILQIDEVLSVDNFWVKVLQSGDNFSELANFALCAVSLPHSNAECERVFSKINLFKTKTRNSLNTQTVNGALLASDCIKSQESCVKFTPSKDMIRRLQNSSQLYDTVA